MNVMQTNIKWMKWRTKPNVFLWEIERYRANIHGNGGPEWIHLQFQLVFFFNPSNSLQNNSDVASTEKLLHFAPRTTWDKLFQLNFLFIFEDLFCIKITSLSFELQFRNCHQVSENVHQTAGNKPIVGMILMRNLFVHISRSYWLSLTNHLSKIIRRLEW